MFIWFTLVALAGGRFVPQTTHLTPGPFSGGGRVALSPDPTILYGERLPTLGSRGGPVVAWDRASGRVMYQLPAAYQTAVASPDGSRLLTVTQEDRRENRPSRVEIWDMRSGRRVAGWERPIQNATWAPDGTVLMWGTFRHAGRLVSVLQWRPGAETVTAPEITESASELVVSPDGSRVVTANYGALDLWRSTDWAHVAHHEGNYDRVGWSTDGVRVWALSNRGTVTTWRAETGREEHRSDIGKDAFRAMSPDARHVLRHDKKAGVLSMWDLAGGRESWQVPWRDIRNRARNVRFVAFLSPSRLVVGDDDHVLLMDRTTGQLVHRVRVSLPFRPEHAVGVGEDRLLLSPDAANTAVVVDVETGQVLESLAGAESVAFDRVAYSPDGAGLLMTSATRGVAMVMDLREGTIRPLNHDRITTVSGAWPLTGGDALAVRTSDGRVLVWAPDDSGALVRVPDGPSLFAGSGPGATRAADVGPGAGWVRVDAEGAVHVLVSPNAGPEVLMEGRRTRISPSDAEPAEHVRAAPAGARFVAHGAAHAVVYDAVSRKLLFRVGHPAPIDGVSFDSAAEHLLVWGGQHASVWRVSDGERVAGLGAGADVSFAAFTSGGVMTAGGREWAIWDLPGGALRHRGKVSEPIGGLAVSEGRAAVGAGSAVVLVDVKRGTTAPLRRAHDVAITGLVAVPGGWVSADRAGALTGWSTEVEARWTGSAGQPVRSLHRVGRAVVTVSEAGTVMAWDARNGDQRTALRRPLHAAHADWLDDTRVLVEGAADEPLRPRRAPVVWDVAEGRPQAVGPPTESPTARFRLPTGELPRIATSVARGDTVVTLKSDGIVVWDARTGDVRQRVTWREPVRPPTMTVSGDAAWALIDGSGARELYDLATGSVVHDFGFGGERRLTAFAPTGGELWVLDEEALSAWSPAEQVAALPEVPDGANELLWSPNGQIVAIRRRAHARVDLWDASTRAMAASLAHDGLVREMTFSADGSRLLTMDRTSWTTWDVATRRQLARQPLDPRHRARWAGEHVLTWGPSGAAVWPAVTGAPSRVVDGRMPEDAVVDVSANGRWAAAAMPDGTVRLWDLPTGAHVATLVALVDEDWALFDTRGRYDARSGARTAAAVWVEGPGPEGAEKRHVPGLLRTIIARTPD